MSKRILVVNGHPDPRPERFCAALCDAYAKGAESRGWTVDRLSIGTLNFPPDSATAATPDIAAAVDKIRAADRLAIVFPLWLDGPPGSLRELFEAFARSVWSAHALGDHATAYEKPARVVATMDMPAFIQRSKFKADGTPGPKPLALPGVQSFEPILIGSLQTISEAQRLDWLEKLRLLGAHEE